MRDIKFRFWHNVTTNNSKSKYFYDADCVIECLKQQINFNEEKPFGYNHIGEDCVFEQFTGLKDKNGNDIYEGDILLETFLNGVTNKYKVFSVSGGFAVNTHQNDLSKKHVIFYNSLGDMQTSGWVTSTVVIGNIHENPELI